MALRLLEIAALTRLGSEGDGSAAADLDGRRAELATLLAAQPEGFIMRPTLAGTRHDLATDPAFAPHRDALLPLFDAAGQGRDALLGRLR